MTAGNLCKKTTFLIIFVKFWPGIRVIFGAPFSKIIYANAKGAFRRLLGLVHNKTAAQATELIALY